jgi:hypothetical protein
MTQAPAVAVAAQRGIKRRAVIAADTDTAD